MPNVSTTATRREDLVDALHFYIEGMPMLERAYSEATTYAGRRYWFEQKSDAMGRILILRKEISQFEA
jgi:hypothetical protein